MTEAICSRCKKEPAKKGQRYCAECRKAYNRRYRAQKQKQAKTHYVVIQ